jgi:hypothetical protein
MPRSKKGLQTMTDTPVEAPKQKRTRRPSEPKDLFIVLPANVDVLAVTRSAADAIRSQDENDGSKIKVMKL